MILGYDPYKNFWNEVDTVYDNLSWLADLDRISQPITLSKRRVYAYRFDRFMLTFVPRFSMLVGFLSAIVPLVLFFS